MEIKHIKSDKITVVLTCSRYNTGINAFEEYQETVVFSDCGRTMFFNGRNWWVTNVVELQIGKELTVNYVNRGDVRCLYGKVESFKVE